MAPVASLQCLFLLTQTPSQPATPPFPLARAAPPSAFAGNLPLLATEMDLPCGPLLLQLHCACLQMLSPLLQPCLVFPLRLMFPCHIPFTLNLASSGERYFYPSSTLYDIM
ncbi:hypothetical protein B0O80DRAFT_445676 [Mortierella sp. GBAus27b]|nr:hypothetical protein B0O80DRAFT_445676 [Mortierella sp. GBAus27b]